MENVTIINQNLNLMKIIGYKIVIVVFVLLFSCESDDVCDSSIAATPSLVIEFYDRTNTSSLKSVTNLKIKEVGNPSFLIFTENNSTLLSATKFKLPLKTGSTTVSYEFNLNADVNASGVVNPASNKDIITFDYTTKDVYISRACGYKTVFEMNDFTYLNNVSDATGESFKWINNTLLITKTIENETTVHLKIYF